MKKLSIFLAMAAVALGFSSCEEDRDPVYQNPTTFVANTPEMAAQYIALTAGENLELTCSQPDYGYSAVCQYSAEVSLTADFAEYKELEAVDASQARIQLKQDAIATAMCELHGFTAETYVDNGPEVIYLRAVCQVKGIESSLIKSNVVSYNQVQGYFAIPTPGFIYLVGQPEGWAGPTEGNAAHYAEWRLFESKGAIGSKIYHGVFNVNAGEAMFRFYSALTGWDADSYGSQVDDNPIEFDYAAGTFETEIIKGKGAFSFPNWPGGEMTISVDMSDPDNMRLTIQEGNVPTEVYGWIYLVGAPEGWKGPEEANAAHYDAWRLYDSTDTDVYSGTFDIPAGQFTFRFYTALTGWDGGASLGAQVEDATIDIALPAGKFTGNSLAGKGGWTLPD